MLEQESNGALDWLERKEMIANPDKFHAVLVTKGRDDTTGEKLMIQGKQIQSDNAVRLLSIQLNSLLVAEARGNHPISRYSANQMSLSNHMIPNWPFEVNS